jgi:hypothetical protein
MLESTPVAVELIPRQDRRRKAILATSSVAAIVLLAFLAATLPPSLCLPPTVDGCFFDVCARTLLRDDILYRDVFLHGPPGMVLARAAIRGFFGWRSETICCADLVIFSAAVCFLLWPGTGLAFGKAQRIWTAFLLYAFYFSTTAFCHNQPDIWMFLPAVIAFSLRQRRIVSKSPAWSWSALVEGVCWGVAFLLKPFVLFPALGCWLGALLYARRLQDARQLARDAVGMLAGGACVGLACASWLWQSGNWPFFWHDVLGPWNSEYFKTWSPWRERLLPSFVTFWPWGLLHVPGLCLAVTSLVAALSPALRALQGFGLPNPLLSGMYLGWFFQSNFIQRQFEYHLVPPLLMAIVVVMGVRWLWQATVLAFVTWTVLYHPLLTRDRLALWPHCWQEGSSAVVRNGLNLNQNDLHAPDWVALAEVASYLRKQGVGNGEVLCYSYSALPLYLELDIKPPTRFVLVFGTVEIFPSHRDEITRSIAEGPQRYVVSDSRLLGRTYLRELGQRQRGPLPRPQDFPPGPAQFFPWTEKIIAGAGQYWVHEFHPGTNPRPVRLW